MIPTPRKCVIPFLSTKVSVHLLAGNAFHLQRLIPLDFQRYQPTFVFCNCGGEVPGLTSQYQARWNNAKKTRGFRGMFFFGGGEEFVMLLRWFSMGFSGRWGNLLFVWDENSRCFPWNMDCWPFLPSNELKSLVFQTPCDLWVSVWTPKHLLRKPLGGPNTYSQGIWRILEDREIILGDGNRLPCQMSME